ncbi:hypothetical protein F4679DRAFT_525195 [Xylaria curta]|nr:hypothetical protein F4679DRAFT_525195 [Xylaria curta]
MAPKKADGGATAAAPKTKSTHASYQDMITDAIIALKDRHGSSRQSLKKYVKANNTITTSDGMFDSQFNKALKAGVEKGVFEQPKGPSGTTKLNKKPKPAPKPAPKKETEKEVKKAAPKKEKEPAKKAATTKKPAAKKEKEAAEKKPAAKKAAPKKAAPKKTTAAKKDTSAAVEKPAAITKTKSGRVAKTAAKPAAKKAAPKTAAPKKEKAPKKEAKTEAAA